MILSMKDFGSRLFASAVLSLVLNMSPAFAQSTISVSALDQGGTVFVVPEEGTYRFAISGGAYVNTPPESQPNNPELWGYTTKILIYMNRPISWSASCYSTYPGPGNWDYELGTWGHYDTIEQADDATVGQYIDIQLNAGDYLFFVIEDCKDCCFWDNSGSVNIGCTIIDTSNEVSLAISVSDTHTGDPIPNADVTIGSQTEQTNSSGQVTFSEIKTGQYNLQISASGYNTHLEILNLNQGGSIFQHVGMDKQAQSANPIITDVVSYVSNRNKAAIFLDRSSCQVNFVVNVDWKDNPPDKIRFITPLDDFDTTDNNRIFDMGKDFGSEGRLKVIAISANGKQSSVFDANILVVPQPPAILFPIPFVYGNQNFSYKTIVNLSLLDEIGTPIPESVPFLGGAQISYNALSEASVEVGSDGTATYTMTVNNYPDNGFKFRGVEYKNEIGGKIVVRYDKNISQWRIEAEYLTLFIKKTKEVGPSYVVLPLVPFPVPTYLRGELEGKLATELGVNGFSTVSGWKMNGTLKPEAGGKVIAGVGASSILALEAALGADVSMQIGIVNSPILKEIEAILSGSIRLVALFYQQEWPLWEYKWSWPEDASTAMPAQSPYALLKDVRSSNWQPIPRKYSGGLATGKVSAQAHTLLMQSNGTEEILPGQQDIYPFSTPAMTRMGDDLLLTWITDDLTRSSNNRTCAVSSRYSSGQWSAPVKIADDGTADTYPAVAAMNSGVVAAWQDSNMQFADDATLSDILPRQEIAVSIYNPNTSTWSQHLRLTNNGYLDRSPVVAANGDQAMVVWVANEGNQILGTPDYPDKLAFSRYYDGTWHTGGVFSADIGTIVRTSLILNDDSTAIMVYIKDEDGDLSTDADQELYVTQFNGTVWTDPVRLTNDTVLDTSPHLTRDSNGHQLLVWYKDGNFMMAKDLDMANARTVVEHMPSSGAQDFQLATGTNGQLQIVWPDTSSNGQNIYMAIYDPAMNLWGSGIQITSSDRMERSLAAAQTSDGKVAVVYNSVELTTETRQVTVGSDTVNIDVPVTGETDLRMASIRLDGDLTAVPDSMAFSPAAFSQGDAVSITASVKNAGLSVQSQIPVAFYYGDPSNGGTEIGTRPVIAGPLAPGATATATVNWQIPKPADVNRRVYIVVDPDISVEDRDRSNNSSSMIAFQPDLAVYRLFSNQMGTTRRPITMGVSNTGNMSASGIDLIVRQGSETGTVVFQQTLDALGPGEARDVVFDWDATGTNGYATFFVSVNPGNVIAESTYLNNGNTLQVPGAFPQPAASPSIPDGTINVPLQPTISWQGDCTSGVTYDVYIWKSGESRPTIPTATGLTSCSYAMTIALDPSAAYLWQVVGTNDSGSTASDIWSFTTGTGASLPGDVNGDGVVDLKDAVMALQVLNGMFPDNINPAGDVDGDGKIGMAEAIYVMQVVAGLR